MGGRSRKRNMFSDEQIKSLEVMFVSESKPEPRTKQQLASDLGLHPRQVAIWFQNRRARLKSKDIEREYSILKASYDTLASKFECLQKENQALATQVQNLRGQLGEDEGGPVDSALPSKHSWREEDKNQTDSYAYLNGLEDKPTYISVKNECEMGNKDLVDACISNPDWLKREDYVQNLVEPVDSSLTSSENSWNSSCFVDRASNSSSLLWEFWS